MTVRDIIELHKLGYTKMEIDEMRQEEAVTTSRGSDDRKERGKVVTGDSVEDSEGSDSTGCDSGVCDLGTQRDFLGDKIADAVKPIQDKLDKMQDTIVHAPVAETPQPTVDEILASWIGGEVGEST